MGSADTAQNDLLGGLLDPQQHSHLRITSQTIQKKLKMRQLDLMTFARYLHEQLAGLSPHNGLISRLRLGTGDLHRWVPRHVQRMATIVKEPKRMTSSFRRYNHKTVATKSKLLIQI